MSQIKGWLMWMVRALMVLWGGLQTSLKHSTQSDRRICILPCSKVWYFVFCFNASFVKYNHVSCIVILTHGSFYLKKKKKAVNFFWISIQHKAFSIVWHEWLFHAWFLANDKRPACDRGDAWTRLCEQLIVGDSVHLSLVLWRCRKSPVVFSIYIVNINQFTELDIEI